MSAGGAVSGTSMATEVTVDDGSDVVAGCGAISVLGSVPAF